MADSIKERILQNWETVLNTIAVAGGYENNIGKVERFHLQEMDQKESIILEIKMGNDSPRESGVGVEERLLQVQTFLKIRHDTEDDNRSTDELFNSVAQDVYRAVCLDRTRGGLARDTIFESSDEVVLEEGATQGVQVMTFSVWYRHLLGDMASA